MDGSAPSCAVRLYRTCPSHRPNESRTAQSPCKPRRVVIVQRFRGDFAKPRPRTDLICGSPEILMRRDFSRKLREKPFGACIWFSGRLKLAVIPESTRAFMPVRQLPEQVVNRIAAGEVVERPASVVKELVENAIDAGAGRIDIFTDGGGRRRIGITDDGDGMTYGDLALAVDRHATSKLDDEDLLRIRTLGFRGEALPSIGAVAKLGITTRHATEPHAWSLAVEGGEKSDIMPAALSQGTRVEVSDLFYATPARLKFLKTDRTEAEAIREVVRRLA